MAYFVIINNCFLSSGAIWRRRPWEYWHFDFIKFSRLFWSMLLPHFGGVFFMNFFASMFENHGILMALGELCESFATSSAFLLLTMLLYPGIHIIWFNSNNIMINDDSFHSSTDQTIRQYCNYYYRLKTILFNECVPCRVQI